MAYSSLFYYSILIMTFKSQNQGCMTIILGLTVYRYVTTVSFLQPVATYVASQLADTEDILAGRCILFVHTHNYQNLLNAIFRESHS